MRFVVKLLAALIVALAPALPASATVFALYVQGNVDYTDDTGLYGAPGTYTDVPFALYMKWNSDQFNTNTTNPTYEVHSDFQTTPYADGGYLFINGTAQAFTGGRGAYAYIGSQPGNPYFVDAASLGSITLGGSSYIIDLAARLRSDLLGPGEGYANNLDGGSAITSYSQRADTGVPSTASIYGQNGGFNIYGTNGTSGSSSGQFRITALSTGVVPEPSTWAMMITGFGLIGFAARRRRSTPTFPLLAA